MTMKTIVLLEDNPDILETTREILELADYRVLTAQNGKDGIRLVKAEKPDLIICDIMMPELDGFGVLRILSKNPDTSDIPFIFLTAKAEKSDLRKGMNLGADDYITKPFEEADLLEAIDTRFRRFDCLKKEFNQNLNGLNEFMDKVRGIEELKNLSRDRKVKRYRKNEVIYREDDYANHVYFISSGKVKCAKSDHYGKRLVSGIHKSGAFIGYMPMFEDGEYQETATAMEPTEVALIPKRDFLALIGKNRDVAAQFIKMLAGNLRDKEKQMLQLAYAPVRERVANTLLRLQVQENGDQNPQMKLVISREDLSNIVGTAKESLIRTLAEFKKEGLVKTDGQQIEILDKGKLKRAASGY